MAARLCSKLCEDQDGAVMDGQEKVCQAGISADGLRMFADDTAVCLREQESGKSEVKVNKRLRGGKEAVGADNWRWRKYGNDIS